MRLELTSTAAGPYLPALDLHLDPNAPVRAAFVSHAHADHLEGHASGTCLASPETMKLIEARRGVRPDGAREIAWDGGALDWPLDGGGAARLSIAPAGHVLGAAQLVIDHPGGRLVYTGDYQSGPGATHAAGAPVECDELVIESTFALPIFRFPPRVETTARLVAWCRARLDANEVPVVLAYALGKSQEVIHALIAAELPVIAHGAVYKLCEAYEAMGVTLGVADGRVKAYAEQQKKRGAREPAVLVVPPGAEVRMIRKLAGAKVAYASGWALLDAALDQRRADAGFVLSDHADSDDLVATAQASGARHVIATHGDARELALVLKANGIEASALASAAIDSREETA